jgi:hypothetical protein
MPATGSIISLKLSGEELDVVAEADVTIKPSSETTVTATSGAPIVGIEKKNPNAEGVQVNASDPAIYDFLEGLANRGEQISGSFTWSGGQVYQSESITIGIGDLSTKTGIVEVMLIPAGKWLKS